jgi:hypothetical protein
MGREAGAHNLPDPLEVPRKCLGGGVRLGDRGGPQGLPVDVPGLDLTDRHPRPAGMDFAEFIGLDVHRSTLPNEHRTVSLEP